MKPLIAACLSMLMLAGCGGDSGPGATDAWVRLPAVPGRPAAAYVTITGGAADDRLVQIATPSAARAELHESMAMPGGAMSMQPLTEVPVAAGTRVDFAPGGRHVMLFGLDPSLKPGGTVRIELGFAQAGTRAVDALLVGAGDPAP